MVQLWKTGWQLYKKKPLKQNYHMIAMLLGILSPRELKAEI